MKKILIALLVIIVLGGGVAYAVINKKSFVMPKKAPVPATNVVANPQKDNGTQINITGPALSLYGKGLTSVPMDTFSKTDLEVLILSNNRLTGSLPSQIGQLKNLKV